MEDKFLDSSLLIGYWRLRQSKARKPADVKVVQKWAEQLIKNYASNAIVTPVATEFLAGFTQGDELKLAEEFLCEFHCIDGRKITAADWDNAMRLAKRIPREHQRRQLGDCLIRAIADRFGYEVMTADRSFPPPNT